MKNRLNNGREKVYLSWLDFESSVYDMLDELSRSAFEPDAIYGILRGGLIHGVALSNALDVPLITELEMTKPLYENRRLLILDDISDTGKTLKELTERLKGKTNYKIFTWVYNKHSKFKPQHYSLFNEENAWVVFPWEDFEE